VYDYARGIWDLVLRKQEQQSLECVPWEASPWQVPVGTSKFDLVLIIRTFLKMKTKSHEKCLTIGKTSSESIKLTVTHSVNITLRLLCLRLFLHRILYLLFVLYNM
jgi:hypothetical protein